MISSLYIFVRIGASASAPDRVESVDSVSEVMILMRKCMKKSAVAVSACVHNSIPYDLVEIFVGF